MRQPTSSRSAPSKKGAGFVQPLAPHQHWRIDISYFNISGALFDLCSVLDGCSRSVVHWELRESMTETEVEIILQRALKKRPEAKPRVISENGPQLIARDFTELIRVAGLCHLRTSPYYPQSNRKIERWRRPLNRERVHPGTPLCADDARRSVANFALNHNTIRLHSAIGYITPADKLSGNEPAIFAAREKAQNAGIVLGARALALAAVSPRAWVIPGAVQPAKPSTAAAAALNLGGPASPKQQSWTMARSGPAVATEGIL